MVTAVELQAVLLSRAALLLRSQRHTSHNIAVVSLFVEGVRISVMDQLHFASEG